MIGGKLASYRIFSEGMTDILARELGNSRPCRTHSSSLPGGDEELSPLGLAKRYEIEPVTATRLEYRHGSRSIRILERMQRDVRQRAVVCPCEPVTEAEVRYAVEKELATSVEDVSRRTRLGLGACGGMRCAAHCGRIVAELTDRSPAEGHAMAAHFLEQAAKRRLSTLGPEQARQEALALAAQRAQVGVET